MSYKYNSGYILTFFQNYKSARLIRLLSFLLLLGGISQVSGQYTKQKLERYSARYGLRLSTGFILAREEATDIGLYADQIYHHIELKQALTQYNAGFFYRQRFGWLYADVSALYNRYGMIYNSTTFTDKGHPTRSNTERFGYVNFQVMGGLISDKFRFAVGPMMFLLAHHDSQLIDLENYSQKLRRVSYGFSGAIGYDFGRFSLDLKYDKAFRTIGDHIYYRYRKSKFFETPDGVTLAISISLREEYIR